MTNLTDTLFQLRKGWHKASSYISGFGMYFMPRTFFRTPTEADLASLQPEEREHVLQRAAYYNRLPEQGTRHYDMQGWPRIKDFHYPFGQKEKHSNYFLDLYRVACHFNPEYRMAYRFGDITHETEVPALVKSRPVTEGPTNSVLLKLNQARHYFLWKDTLGFRSKKDMLVSRNVVRQPWRRLLLEEYAGHPLCDIGQTNRDTNTDHPEWMKDYLTIPRQLEYKFIACIEGNDVATNLKWVMASNSLAVMPRPRYETWFMEGRLIPDYHYVEIKEDYSDLPEKLGHYIRHPEQAESIIAHAHEHVRQFLNPKREKLISLLVMESYLRKTGQTHPTE